MNEVIKIIMQTAGMDAIKAQELLTAIKPPMTKEIITERPSHLIIDYVQGFKKRQQNRDNGDVLVIEDFQLSEARISIFSKNEESLDHTPLIGTRVCFLITKANVFNGKVSYTGQIISAEEAVEKIGALNYQKAISKTVAVENSKGIVPKPISLSISKGS